ncbi:hypothetical protein DFP72DRAFT_1104576 [Ephemerocybe angulata]|uniref:Uncharacterized protein n=1 Tax=Ephemerocybe angulata TaxID=980116 RepID=A0A8H6LU42_9AGAR|nr:hypothetical protein DFP72DRAFT_1104576 [Tulosesus angulatus]
MARVLLKASRPDSRSCRCTAKSECGSNSKDRRWEDPSIVLLKERDPIVVRVLPLLRREAIIARPNFHAHAIPRVRASVETEVRARELDLGAPAVEHQFCAGLPLQLYNCTGVGWMHHDKGPGQEPDEQKLVTWMNEGEDIGIEHIPDVGGGGATLPFTAGNTVGGWEKAVVQLSVLQEIDWHSPCGYNRPNPNTPKNTWGGRFSEIGRRLGKKHLKIRIT